MGQEAVCVHSRDSKNHRKIIKIIDQGRYIMKGLDDLFPCKGRDRCHQTRISKTCVLCCRTSHLVSGSVEGVIGEKHGPKDTDHEEHHRLVRDGIHKAVDHLRKGFGVELCTPSQGRILLHTSLPSHTCLLHGWNSELGATSVFNVLFGAVRYLGHDTRQLLLHLDIDVPSDGQHKLDCKVQHPDYNQHIKQNLQVTRKSIK